MRVRTRESINNLVAKKSLRHKNFIIDLNKAFDTVRVNDVIAILQEISPNYIKVIKELKKNITTRKKYSYEQNHTWS